MVPKPSSIAAPKPGAVFHFAYLWHHEFVAGQIEARRDRPALSPSANAVVGPMSWS
jgi:hypothetical protein